jgi:Tol biopolymer transport system component
VRATFLPSIKAKLLLPLVALLVLSNISYAQFYNGSQTDFGKNRVKYEDFFWTYYQYDRYDVYFYEEGKDLANYVAKSAKKQMLDIERLFDYSFDEKIQFLVYNKQSDFRQSNIGLATEEEYNTGGVTRIAGSKIILYYEGDHAKLDAQIRAGVAQVLLDQMMYGGNVREMVKNNTLLNIPQWFSKGLVDYVSVDWNSDIDNRVKDGVLTGKYKNINRLEGEDAVYAGHALWKHIADNYGEAVISNILYMTKVSRNTDNASLFVLGISVKNLWRECYDSYQKKYSEKDTSKTLPKQAPLLAKPKASRVYSKLKLSPDGNYALYTTNEMGQYKIWLYDFQKNKAKRIVKIGHKIDRINDYSYPLLAWHPSGKLFSYIEEKKGYLVMTTYELETKDKSRRNITGFEKVLDYAYNSDGKRFVMSAVQKGQTDLYLFTSASNGYDQLTKDLYDDLSPRFVHGDKEIVFASNRPVDTLFFDAKRRTDDAKKYKDLFVFNNVTKSPVLKRVTNTPGIDESFPADYDSTHISYLSDLNGIRNRYIARFDSALAYVDTAAHYRTVVTSSPITNYSRNILEQEVNVKANKITEIIYESGKYKMYVTPLVPVSELKIPQLKNTSYRDYKNRIEKKEQVEEDAKNKVLNETPYVEDVKVIINPAEKVKKDSTQIDINNYSFENEQPKPSPKKAEPAPVTTAVVANDTLKAQKDAEFVLGRQRNYNLNYSVDYVVSQLDNSFLNASYQKFTGGGSPIYLNPGINAFFKIGMSDLFEDYRIVGGMRIPFELFTNLSNFNMIGGEYLLSYENRIKKIDKQLIIHREAHVSLAAGNSLVKVFTNDIRYILKYPFSEVAGLRGTIMYRNDNIVYTATDSVDLSRPDTYENWVTGKLEYVYDNTIKRGLNLYNGFRGKLFGEYYRQIDKKETDFFVIGLDARYYKKLHRDLIWANRIAASTSFGKQKLIYYMGGVDNWFGPRFDNTTNIATDQNYAYQTLATNMRGFFQNVRNGNSFAVINSEIRFPIFKYLYKRPIRSDFVQNFQIITFGDVGTAWTGPSPYSDKNSLNTTVIAVPGNPLEITLNTQHNPIVGGYGFGIRSRLFGYFIRLDRAWGIQDGIVLKPLWYLSFSLDF